jgi:hypothetical protein
MGVLDLAAKEAGWRKLPLQPGVARPCGSLDLSAFLQT